MRSISLMISGLFLYSGFFMAAVQAKSQFPVFLPIKQVTPLTQQQTQIDLPMLALQVMLETYAMDHGGHYPHSLYELYPAAEKGGYGMNTLTRKGNGVSSSTREGKSILSDLAGVIFVDNTRMITPPLGAQGNFPAQFVWIVNNQHFKTQWFSRADAQIPAQGTVVYMPVLRENVKEPIQSYVILRTNAQGVYYANKQSVYFVTNIDLQQPELPEEKAVLKFLKRPAKG